MTPGGKLCCIFNVIPHYRAAICGLIYNELRADFYAGDRTGFRLKLMNYTDLPGFKRKLRYRRLPGSAYLLSGASALGFKRYTTYIITGDIYCISTWILLVINKILGKKTYLWSHGYYGDEGRLKSFLKRAYFGISTGILLYGERARDIMIKRGFNPSRLHVIYNSLDYDTQVAVRSSLKPENISLQLFGNDLPVVIFAGRIQKIKRLELLLEAVSQLKDKKRPVNLVIVGDGKYVETLRDLSAALRITNHVNFYGACYNEEELGKLLYNADVCVSPGNVGLTAIHSLTYGTPVITHDNFSRQMPEYEAVEPGVTGDFFNEGSIADLCKKIEPWLGQTQKERMQTRSNCYGVINQKFNPGYQIKAIKEAIFI